MFLRIISTPEELARPGVAIRVLTRRNTRECSARPAAVLLGGPFLAPLAPPARAARSIPPRGCRCEATGRAQREVRRRSPRRARGFRDFDRMPSSNAGHRLLKGSGLRSPRTAYF